MYLTGIVVEEVLLVTYSSLYLLIALKKECLKPRPPLTPPTSCRYELDEILS